MMKLIHRMTPALVLAGGMIWSQAQVVTIPDPNLNAAIRETLNKPVDPLTEQDLLNLTTLNATGRGIKSITGIEAARNLTALFLRSNQLTNVTIPDTLTSLATLDLRQNNLASLTLPVGMTNLSFLDAGENQLTNVTLSAGLASLADLILDENLLTRIPLPPDLANLRTLHLQLNSLTEFVLPSSSRNVATLDLSQNEISRATLPPAMTNLSELNFFFNQLTNLTLPSDLRSLTELDLQFNQLKTLELPSSLPRLVSLRLQANFLISLNLPVGMTALKTLDLRRNQLTELTLPSGLDHLFSLGVSSNKLTSLTLPPGMTNLGVLFLRFNQLTNLTLPSDLTRVFQIDVIGNQIANLSLPSGLGSLSNLFLAGNQLTSLTLPPDMAQLNWLVLEGNPLNQLVLSETLAAANLASTVEALESRGVNIFTYPVVPELVKPLALVGAFKFGITGPPGTYTVLASSNLTSWSVLDVKANPIGSLNFVDVTANASPKKFYRVLLQPPPTNMVFIPPNTFTMGTPATEVNRQADEGPQTTVTITHGFWIGKYEVTQSEYLAVVGSNPSQFTGNLDRPVETVSWPDATNYCAQRTQQELAAGRIAPGSRYRLPTEAEWECAARAGTSTRFSYGDDPTFADLTKHAWYGVNSGFVSHPVGQKAANPWGLYDMEGNVWEWTQDWYGPYPGGSVTDPQGPASNPQGVRVIRGGAWDAFQADCRSGRRLTEGVSPFITDFILGFRVVLVTEP